MNRGYQPSYTPVTVGASGSSMSFPKKDNQVVGKVSTVKTVIPIQKVSQSEMRERTQRGLCYFCDEKWNPNHKCDKKKAKVFLMEGMELFQEEEEKDWEVVEEKATENNEDLEDEIPEISLHAIAGFLNPRTMRIQGRVKDCVVVILIDTGSTHNFLDPMVARKIGL